MPDQNHKNHTRYIPLFHFGVYILVAIVIGISVIKIYKSSQYDFRWLWLPCTLLVIGVTLLLLTWYARVFALKAQDRAIRAEENLRHFVMTGKLLDSSLKTSQVVALRFASDEEFVALAGRAAKENLSSKQIKEAVKNWKGDFHRV